MSGTKKPQRVTLVSFSGIDGAGKSTQIEMLSARLAQAGIRFSSPTFWDDIVVLPRLRESASYAVFKGERGVGSPAKPIHRRDKNVRSWPVTIARLILYLLDAVSLALAVVKAKTTGVDVVIFDRYIYDELVNLPLNYWSTFTFVRLVLKFVPRPDIAFVIDAEPHLARERKPEYPLDFIRHNRAAYLMLRRLVEIRVIPPSTAAEMHSDVMNALSEKLPFPRMIWGTAAMTVQL